MSKEIKEVQHTVRIRVQHENANQGTAQNSDEDFE